MFSNDTKLMNFLLAALTVLRLENFQTKQNCPLLVYACIMIVPYTVENLFEFII